MKNYTIENGILSITFTIENKTINASYIVAQGKDLQVLELLDDTHATLQGSLISKLKQVNILTTYTQKLEDMDEKIQKLFN